MTAGSDPASIDSADTSTQGRPPASDVTQGQVVTRVALWPGSRGDTLTEVLAKVSAIELDVVESAEALPSAIERSEVLIAPDGALTDAGLAAIRSAPRLRWIHLASAGYDRLQSVGCPPGVLVSNSGAALAPAVAEHAVVLLLSLLRRLPTALRQQDAQDWSRGYASQARSLDGMTVVIVGFGWIGQQAARLLRPFGARIIGVNRSGRPNPLADEMATVGTLSALLPRAEALLIAVPMTPGAAPLIGAAELGALPAGALLVNVARGGLVDTEALAAALETGSLGGAAVDVTDPEPLPPEHPLWRAPNVIVTPHVAGSGGPAGQRRRADLIAANLRRFLSGERPEYLVALSDERGADCV